MNLVNENGDWLDTENCWINPRWACHSCTNLDDLGNPTTKVEFAEERYSFGIYAGKYCDKCWKKSGYKDEPASSFDCDYCGERLEADY